MKLSIIDYNIAKLNQSECLAWVAVIDRVYKGGGGGGSELLSVHIARWIYAPVISSQESGGAKNYYPMPAALAPYLDASIKARFGDLVADALARQEAAIIDMETKAGIDYKDKLDAEVHRLAFDRCGRN